MKYIYQSVFLVFSHSEEPLSPSGGNALCIYTGDEGLVVSRAVFEGQLWFSSNVKLTEISKIVLQLICNSNKPQTAGLDTAFT